MSRIRTHLLLTPLETPPPPAYRTDTVALMNAARLYDQLIAKGYDEATAQRLSQVGRMNGAPITYSQPEDGAA